MLRRVHHLVRGRDKISSTYLLAIWSEFAPHFAGLIPRRFPHHQG